VVVPGVAVLLSGGFFLPALLTAALSAALPLLIAAAMCLGTASPPLDAARLDIIHPALWGRAEAVRSVLRSGSTALAPLVFGLLAQHLLGGRSGGLQGAFLSMLVTLVAAALLTLGYGRRSYPCDVAAVAESLRG
jgi:hypothetical protein